MKKSIRVPQGLIYWMRVATLGVVVGVGLQFASAWTNPTATPPLGNVSGPVTTSAIAQYKAGAIGFGGLVKAYLGIDANNNRIVNVATPIDGKDAVNKDYVDAASSGASGELCGSLMTDFSINGYESWTYYEKNSSNSTGCAYDQYRLIVSGMKDTHNATVTSAQKAMNQWVRDHCMLVGSSNVIFQCYVGSIH